ncbi:MAG: hypothetical protein ACYC91_17810 [Solirubrobacteraceae bacterium]
MTAPGFRPRGRLPRSPACLAPAFAVIALAGCGSSHNSITANLTLPSAPLSPEAAGGKLVSYLQYRPGHPIGVAGSVEPPPAVRWKAKIKLKRCVGGAFSDLRSIRATITSQGRFGASIPALPHGYYVVRANVKEAAESTRTPKVYFRVAQTR